VIREGKSDAALTRAVVSTHKYPSEQGGGGGFHGSSEGRLREERFL